MNGPSDELHGSTYPYAEPEDTPLDNEHLRPPAFEPPPPPAAALTFGLDDPLRADPELADLIERRPPRRTVDEMLADDERARREAEAERAEEARKWRSSDPLEQLEVKFKHYIWTKADYDDLLVAEEVLEDVIKFLRGDGLEPYLLKDVWDQGFEAGADWLSRCCGCSGNADEVPKNPYHGRVVHRQMGL